MVKRSFDIILSVAGLLLLMPVLGLIAIAIRTTTDGPAFCRGVRVGKSSREFQIPLSDPASTNRCWDPHEHHEVRVKVDKGAGSAKSSNDRTGFRPGPDAESWRPPTS